MFEKYVYIEYEYQQRLSKLNFNEATPTTGKIHKNNLVKLNHHYL